MLFGVVLGVLLANTGIGFFFAKRAVVMLKIGSVDTIWKGPVPMIMGILGPFTYVLPLAMLLVLLAEPLTGTSPGKSMLGLKIIPYNKAILSKKSLWCRTAIKSVFFWGLVVALLSGNWILALCATVMGCAVLCNMVLSLLFYIRPIHETQSQTCVTKIAVT
jgi:hypothetical protein